jgi:hypothetical protein
LNATEQAVLQSIADQCPLAGGNAVFAARSMIALYSETDEYDDENRCLSVGMLYRNTQDALPQVEKLTLIPNPADNNLQVKSKEMFINGELSMYDIYGRLILQTTLPTDKNELNIDVSNIPVGVYSIRLSNNGLKETERLVIIH